MKITALMLTSFIFFLSLTGCSSVATNLAPQQFDSAHDYISKMLTPTFLGIEVPISGDQNVYLFHNALHVETKSVTRKPRLYLEDDIQFVAYSNDVDTTQLQQPLIHARKYCGAINGNFRRTNAIQGQYFTRDGRSWRLHNTEDQFVSSRPVGAVPIYNNPSKRIEEALFVSDKYFGSFKCESKNENWIISIVPIGFLIEESVITTAILIKVNSTKHKPNLLMK